MFMKDNLIVIAFFLLSTIITGQTVQSDSLHLYVGKKITVCDVVIDAHRNRGNELTTFLNFGSPYPNQVFTVVIFYEYLKNFANDPSKTYLGKKICVTGKVRIYNGKSGIIVKKSNQIIIVD